MEKENKKSEQELLEEIGKIKSLNVEEHQKATIALDKQFNCGHMAFTVIEINGKKVEVPLHTFLSCPIYIRSVSK
jgi:hypothetical protein